MNDKQKKDFFNFLVHKYKGGNSSKGLSEKSAQDCIYRLNFIEKNFGLELSKISPAGDSSYIEDLKIKIKIYFTTTETNGKYQHLSYNYSIRMLEKYLKYCKKFS